MYTVVALVGWSDLTMKDSNHERELIDRRQKNTPKRANSGQRGTGKGPEGESSKRLRVHIAITGSQLPQHRFRLRPFRGGPQSVRSAGTLFRHDTDTFQQHSQRIGVDIGNPFDGTCREQQRSEEGLKVEIVLLCVAHPWSG